ncbi:hypothetical protein [Collinsella provencensis]|uniref:hypothetical protein n=1 Tax=Collinsella provencensis TaxID=1937461 RepID=UPI00131B4DC1|nr:hypothetical protein [Collinsella provencensis]
MNLISNQVNQGLRLAFACFLQSISNNFLFTRVSRGCAIVDIPAHMMASRTSTASGVFVAGVSFGSSFGGRA